jgi:hypothetical protein
MRRIDSFKLSAALLCLLSVTQRGAIPAANAAPPGPVQFHPAVYVDPPPLLGADASDGRCPDPTQPCLQDNDDLLFGRTHILRSDDLALTTHPSGVFSANLTLLTTANSVATPETPAALPDDVEILTPTVIGARMFDNSTDAAITLYTSAVAGGLVWRIDDLSGKRASDVLSLSGEQSFAPYVLATDLTGDGLDEVVIWTRSASTAQTSVAVVATAADPTDPSKGLTFGPVYTDQTEPVAIVAMTVAAQPRLMLAGRPPTGGTGCNGYAGLVLNAYTVDPKTLTISAAGSWQPLPASEANTCFPIIDLTVGRLGTGAYDQLALLYASDNETIKVMGLDMDANGNPVSRQVFDTTFPASLTTGPAGTAQIESARFDWGGALDQVALLVHNCSGCTGNNTLSILHFDGALNITSGQPFVAAPDNLCDGEMVIGNFDRQQPNPGTPPPATIPDPNLQIAVPFNDCSSNTYLTLFDVDPGNDFAITALTPAVTLATGVPTALTALDLQGRSLRVGPPDIVTVQGRQLATLVLAAPPMHVDALIPIGGTNPNPVLFNISGAPKGFYAGYSFSDSENTKTDTTTSLSWAFGAKESVGAKATFGSCKVGDCASVGFKFSAQQALSGSQASLTGHYFGSSESLALTTGFADLVSTQGDTLTIYVYPVIGRTVCPSTLPPDCDDADQVPMTVTLSGPDTLLYREGFAGSTFPWYQPVWMPGHLLSYPGSTEQLEQGAFANPDDFVKLSEADAWLVGGDGTASKSISWSAGTSSGSTTSTKQNFSFDAGLSASGKVGLTGFATVQTDASLDFSGSRGFADLTNTLKTLQATQGIQLSRLSSFLSDPNYDYQVIPQIFGKQQPATVVDSNSAPADVQTFGALRVGYAVDLLSFGAYWQVWYGQAPDLALNQPAHMTVTFSGTDLGNGACLPTGVGPGYNCVRLGDRVLSGLGEIWLSAFHWMRGLFISGPGGGGPQLSTATSGDQLLLQARVYNLSMAALTGVNVHVRFMAMPWNASSNTPAGASFVIGEQVLAGAQLPPYNIGDDPNWTLAAQPFDTSGTQCGGQACDNLDLLFWVAVWGENTDGTLLTELPLHGLASPPAAGEDFVAIAGREQTYSNNLGLYNQVFHIFPQQASAQPVAAPAAGTGETGPMIVTSGTSAREIQRGETLALAVQVESGPRDLNGGLEVAFYDGDPTDGGKPAGLQYLPFLNANSLYDFRVADRPEVCGRHWFHAVAGEGSRHAHSVVMKPVDVLCPDMAKLAGRITAKAVTQGGRLWTIAVSNSGAALAHQARIDGLTLTSLNETDCTPKVPTAFPLTIGDIPPGGKASGAVTIDFTGCAATTRFRADIAFSSNDGVVTGTATLNNQFR